MRDGGRKFWPVYLPSLPKQSRGPTRLKIYIFFVHHDERTWRLVFLHLFAQCHPITCLSHVPVLLHSIIVGFTLEAKLISSKYLIQVLLEILSRSVENMAPHLLTNYITWSKAVNLSVLETAARTHRAHGFHFLLVKCVLKCGVAHTWRRTSVSLNYERFHGHQVKLK